jgi:vitamin B12 transporter
MRTTTVAAVFCVLSLAGLASAQPPATVSGTVMDVSGAVIPDATVEAVVADRVVSTASTGEDGRYGVQVPQNVRYELRVRSAGFAEYVATMRGAGGVVTHDVTLQVGGVSDTLVVTATRGAEARTSATQSTSVMTAADVQALGSASLADVLRFMPALSVEGTGREGGVTSLFSRGGESDYNLVLIDGVRANQNGGYFDFSRISAGEIDRVEVLRGAQSSLWGSDAIGAVIQVFTKRAGATDAPQVSGSVEGGSFNTWRGDARVTGGVRGRMNYHAGSTYRGSDGAFADILPEKDWFEQTSFDGGLGGALGNRASLRTNVRYSHAQGRAVGPTVYGARDTGTQYDTKDLTWYLDTSHAIGRQFTGSATVNYFRYTGLSEDGTADPPYNVYAILEGTPNALFPDGTQLVRLIDQAEFNALAATGALPAPGQFLASAQGFDFPFRSTIELRRPAFRYQGDYAWARGQRLSAGYDWERESNPLVTVHSLDNHALFVQQQFNVHDRWFITVGARGDFKESYDRFFSPKLSAGGFPVPFRTGALSSLKIFGNIGRGIKAPTFSERFGASFADPNPDLEVERARTADLGTEATFADQRLRGTITYFNNDYRDQIAFRSGTVGDGIPEFINIDGSRAKGWEFEVALQRPLAGVTAAGTYSFVDTAVVTNISTSQQFQPGQTLLRRPKHAGSLRAAYTAGRATVSGDVRFVGQRHDNSFLFLRTVPNAERPTAITTDITVNPGYVVAGLGIDVRAHDTLTLFFRVANLGDTAYESALGYAGLPRSAMLGMRFNVSPRR